MFFTKKFQAEDQATECLVDGTIDISFMPCLDQHNYFGKILAPHRDTVLKVMRFSQVLANVDLSLVEFNRILGIGLKATGYPLKDQENE